MTRKTAAKWAESAIRRQRLETAQVSDTDGPSRIRPRRPDGRGGLFDSTNRMRICDSSRATGDWTEFARVAVRLHRKRLDVSIRRIWPSSASLRRWPAFSHCWGDTRFSEALSNDSSRRSRCNARHDTRTKRFIPGGIGIVPPKDFPRVDSRRGKCPKRDRDSPVSRRSDRDR